MVTIVKKKSITVVEFCNHKKDLMTNLNVDANDNLNRHVRPRVISHLTAKNRVGGDESRLNIS